MKILRRKRVYILLITAILFLATVISFSEYLKIGFYPIVKRFEKNRILENVTNYKKIETDHFIISYESGEEDSAELTGKIAEKYYDEVISIFNYESKEKANVVIYSNGKKLLENVRLNKEVPPIGIYYSGVINLLSPKDWIDDEENLEQIYEVNGPVIHEFTHLIVDEMTKGNYPMWLTEGIALFTEYKLTGFEWGKDMDFDTEIPMSLLNNKFTDLDQNTAYRKSFEVIRDIDNEWGFDKVNTLLDNLGRGSDMRSSTKAVLKVNLYDIR